MALWSSKNIDQGVQQTCTAVAHCKKMMFQLWIFKLCKNCFRQRSGIWLFFFKLPFSRLSQLTDHIGDNSWSTLSSHTTGNRELLLKWIDSLKKFGYIFNAVFFHVPPPTSLEFLYSLFLWCCCFYVAFLQKPVWITAGPIAITQCLEQGIF